MKNYVLLLFLVLMSCATTQNNSLEKARVKQQKEFEKLSEGFIVQKLPNWEFHGFHGMLNYTPKQLMFGHEYISNGLTVTKRPAINETLESAVNKYIYLRENSRYDIFRKLKRVKEQTKYGESTVLIYTIEVNGIEYKVIKQFYVYNDMLYIVGFTAKSQFFSYFVNDAIHMMKTFTITSEKL